MQDLGFRDRLDELFVGTPSLTIVKLLLSDVAERDLAITLLDIKSAFLYGAMRRNAYVELQDPNSDDSNLVGKLKKAMYCM